MRLQLEKAAKSILDLKYEVGLRRPLLIEFCGTPKAGKTTTINALNIFLKRNGFKTVVINEMAAVCPIHPKTNFFFNSWTLFESLAETLKQLTIGENTTDIILIDRSIFDALCWFKWLAQNPEKNPYLGSDQYQVFVDFLVGHDMWTRHTDLVFIFKADPATALKREFAELVTTRFGSIMNEPVLSGFNQSIDLIKVQYKSHFRKIEEINTTNEEQAFVSLTVTQTVLNNLRELVTEKIGYLLDTFASFLSDGINDFGMIAGRPLFFQERHLVEEENYIQPVIIAVITDKERKKVLVLRKTEAKTGKTSPEFNRTLLYLGGHVRKEDQLDHLSNLKVFKRALEREIKEEINEVIHIGDQEPFLIYTPVSIKSKKHLAVCFVIEMDLENKKFSTKDEFVQKSANSKSGTIISAKDILSMKDELETWSLAISKHVFKLTTSLFD